MTSYFLSVAMNQQSVHNTYAHWGHGAVGSASAWHAEGREFESRWLHWTLITLNVVLNVPAVLGSAAKKL